MSVILHATMQFMVDLEKNNNREWFSVHKDRYEAWLKNGKDFLNDLTIEMNKIDRIERSKLFRIYKDVRFAKDKTPYNTHMSMSLDRAKPHLRGGYYLRLKNGESMLACGFWRPEPSDLALIRGNIDRDGQAMRQVLSNPSILKYFDGFDGESLKSAPKGVDKNHPDIDLMRYKSFVFTRNLTDEEVVGKQFLIEVLNGFRAIRPFFDYMSDILGHNLNGEPLY